MEDLHVTSNFKNISTRGVRTIFISSFNQKILNVCDGLVSIHSGGKADRSMISHHKPQEHLRNITTSAFHAKS